MIRLLPYRMLLTCLVGFMLSGCAARPPEKPIVLRRPYVEPRIARASPPKRPAVSSPAAVPNTAPTASDTELTPDQKADLFEQFDRFLSEPKKSP